MDLRTKYRQSMIGGIFTIDCYEIPYPICVVTKFKFSHTFSSVEEEKSRAIALLHMSCENSFNRYKVAILRENVYIFCL